MQIDIDENEMMLKINKSLIENSGTTYLPGLFYQKKEKQEENERWMISQAFKMFPLGNYMDSIQGVESPVEDEETYELILAKQENDENIILEKDEVSLQKISVEKLKDHEYLLSNFYTVDSSTSIPESLLNAEQMLKKDMTLNKSGDGPKVLIYHTHSQEAFKDSRKKKKADTIMGMGAFLSKLLNEEYGIKTLHHEGVYDLIDGKLDRSRAYQLAEPQIREILKQNPSIEVVIDLHRDGVKESTHLVTEIEGEKTAQIMFFNGVSRTRANGNIEYLYNPYIEDNLAFSLQMQLKAMEKYPGLTRRIYLKSYRYNMHLMPKTLLIEAGAQTNTVKEMKNAMRRLAEILDSVLND